MFISFYKIKPYFFFRMLTIVITISEFLYIVGMI